MSGLLFNIYANRFFNKGFAIFVFCLFGGTSLFATSIGITKERTKKVDQHALPIQEETLPISSSPPEVLLPMPMGDVGTSSAKVKSSRNPFDEPSTLEIRNMDLISSVIQFSGIAKSGDLLVAMIKTNQGQKAYKVGDSLGNGFVIKSISSADVTVDISNGSRNYRLSLKTFRK